MNRGKTHFGLTHVSENDRNPGLTYEGLSVKLKLDKHLTQKIELITRGNRYGKRRLSRTHQ